MRGTIRIVTVGAACALILGLLVALGGCGKKEEEEPVQTVQPTTNQPGPPRQGPDPNDPSIPRATAPPPVSSSPAPR